MIRKPTKLSGEELMLRKQKKETTNDNNKRKKKRKRGGKKNPISRESLSGTLLMLMELKINLEVI